MALGWKKARRVAYQAAALAALAAGAWFLISNTAANLADRRIASGFGFLGREAGFEIGESFFLRYDAADTYLHALAVGLVNTLTVSAIGIVIASVLGTAIGLLRLSSNGSWKGVAGAYVEFIRNVPLLVQLFFWYSLITDALPGPREALEPLPHVFLTNRGIFLPSLSSVPALQGFNFAGGIAVSPEFGALLVGLSIYTAAFIAEIVRAGIQAVPRGQLDAGAAIGLSDLWILRKIVFPQALRVILPPLASQYLNLVKNSSLAVAIGYPDLVSVANTTMNQTGQAIEGVTIIMAVYLTISLSISALTNWYNAGLDVRRALR
jgi:general L-amino acid transport system permease protein